MEDEKFELTIDIYPSILLTLVFIVLKFAEVIEWEWVWIFTPLYVYVMVFIILLIFLMIVGIIKNVKNGGGPSW